MTANRPIRIAIIGAGAVSDYHHVPAIRLNPRADSSQALLDARWNDCWVEFLTDDYEKVCGHDDIDAVIAATPNDVHHPIATAAAGHGKHVMCEKPLGLSATEVREMYHAARDARVHMTAFTYRFAPAMRYLRHLVASRAMGEPRHFRSQRFLDLPESSWRWRQYKGKAGAGDLFDMTIHCIDFAIKGYDLMVLATNGLRSMDRKDPRCIDCTSRTQFCSEKLAKTLIPSRFPPNTSSQPTARVRCPEFDGHPSCLI